MWNGFRCVTITHLFSTAVLPLLNGGDGSWMWTHFGRTDKDSLDEVANGGRTVQVAQSARLRMMAWRRSEIVSLELLNVLPLSRWGWKFAIGFRTPLGVVDETLTPSDSELSSRSWACFTENEMKSSKLTSLDFHSYISLFYFPIPYMFALKAVEMRCWFRKCLEAFHRGLCLTRKRLQRCDVEFLLSPWCLNVMPLLKSSKF